MSKLRCRAQYNLLQLKQMVHANMTCCHTDLQPSDNLSEVFCVVIDGAQRYALAALVVDPHGRGAPARPADHISCGTVEHNCFRLLIQQDDEVIRNSQQAFALGTSHLILSMNLPGNGPQAPKLCPAVWAHLLPSFVR